MPGLITHYIHGEATLNELPKDIAKEIKISREFYNIGTQGPDLFFYYLPALVSRRLYGLGTKMHTGNFSLFLKCMAEDIKSSGNNRDLRSYLYGYLTHYALDTATHPYIYYKTGFRRAGELRTLKYSAYHRSFETALDVMMLKLATGEKTSDKKLSNLVRLKKPLRAKLSQLLSRNIRRAYKTDISAGQVSGAFNYISGITWLLESKNGRRKRITEFVEGLTVKDKIVSSLIHHGAAEEGIDYLNSARGSWRLPWDSGAENNQSFVDMFNESVSKAAEMIRLCHDYFEGQATLKELCAGTKNLSFATGLHYSDSVEFVHSDIVYGLRNGARAS